MTEPSYLCESCGAELVIVFETRVMTSRLMCGSCGSGDVRQLEKVKA